MQFTYYSGFFLRGGVGNMCSVIRLARCKLFFLFAASFLPYAAERSAPYYYVGLLPFSHVEGGMSVWLPSALANFLSHFDFQNLAERVRVDRPLAALALPEITKANRFFFCGQDKFVVYDYVTGQESGYPAEIISPLKRQKLGDGSVL